MMKASKWRMVERIYRKQINPSGFTDARDVDWNGYVVCIS